MANAELLNQAELFYWRGQFPEALHLLEQLDSSQIEDVEKQKIPGSRVFSHD